MSLGILFHTWDIKSKKVVVICLFVIISSLLILVGLYPGGSVAISFYLDAGQFTISAGVMLCIKCTTLGSEPTRFNASSRSSKIPPSWRTGYHCYNEGSRPIRRNIRIVLDFFYFEHQTWEDNKPIIKLVIPRICSPAGSVLIPLRALFALG